MGAMQGAVQRGAGPTRTDDADAGHAGSGPVVERAERHDLALGRVEQDGGHEVGGEVGERGEHEPPLPHPRVGHLEIGLVDDLAVHPEHVDVEGAGTPALGRDAPGGVLEASAHLQQAARVEVGVELDDEVQVGALLRATDGLGLVDR